MSPGAHGQGSPARPGSELTGLTAALDTSGVDAAFAKAKRVLRAQAATAPERLDRTWAAIADTLDADRASGGEGWADGRTTAGSPDARTRVGQIVAAAQPAGISGPKIFAALRAEGYDVGRSTVYEWLNAHFRDGGYGAWHPKNGSEQ